MYIFVLISSIWCYGGGGARTSSVPNSDFESYIIFAVLPRERVRFIFCTWLLSTKGGGRGAS